MSESQHPFRVFRLGALALGLALALALAGCGSDDGPAGSSSDGKRQTLQIGVGPLLPTPGETTKAWDPFFAWLSGELGVDYELTATTD